jgi:hypothetical protein
LATMMALPMASAGRFSPLGPRGMAKSAAQTVGSMGGTSRES